MRSDGRGKKRHLLGLEIGLSKVIVSCGLGGIRDRVRRRFMLARI
jgi:hypothetical protein